MPHTGCAARGYSEASTAYDYAPSANGSVDRSAASSQRRVRQQNAYRVFPRDPACAGGAPRATARALTENAACACRVRSIGRVDTTGCASSAGPTTAGVQLIRCVNRALRNSGASPDVSRRRETDTDYRGLPGSAARKIRAWDGVATSCVDRRRPTLQTPRRSPGVYRNLEPSIARASFLVP